MHAPTVDRPATPPLRQSNEEDAVDRFVSEGGSVPTALRDASCAAPTQDEYAVMAAHGIEFDGSGFRFAGFRHAHLIDALRQSRQAGQGCE